MTGRPPPRPASQSPGGPIGRAVPRQGVPGHAGVRSPRPTLPGQAGVRPPRPTVPGGQLTRPPSSSVGRALPPDATPPGGPTPPSGVPGRSSGPPGRTSGPPLQRAGPTPPPGSAAAAAPPQQRPPGSGLGPWSAGRGLYRAEHRASVAPPGSAIGADDSIPSGGVANLTIGSRSSGGSAEHGAGAVGSGNGNGNGNGEEASAGRGTMRGARIGRELLRTRPDNLQSKLGTSGQPFKCISNYFRVNQRPDWSLVQFRVDFAPEEDRTFVRKRLLRVHMDELCGGRYIFDGTVMFTVGNLNGSDTMQLVSRREDDGQMIQISIRKVGVVSPSDQHYFQFFNIMIRKVMEKLDLQLLGRNYYDSKAGIKLDEWKLELWMGYVTSMRQHENDVLLCCEIGNKILRLDTVYDQLRTCMRDRDGRSSAQRLLLGAIVITRYNNKTYRIDDIAWDKGPSQTFPKKDGSEISYAQYYQERYGIRIKDLSQPLIISMPKRSQLRAGQEGPVYLVPETCHMTGLSDEQRANFKLMKALGEYTRQAPPERLRSLNIFSKRIQETPVIAEELRSWGLKLSPTLETFKGRTLPPEKICQAQGRPELSYSVENADWGSQFRNFKMFNSGGECAKWIMITSSRDEKIAREFVSMVIKASAGMGYLMKEPRVVVSRDNRTAAYAEEASRAADLSPQMIMVIVPNNRGDTYHAVKKILCVDKPTPSQVVTGTLLSKGKGLMSVATKVAIQMAAKLGAEPWGVVIPMRDTMVVGYDSYHDSAQKGLAVGAVVATMNQSMTRFSSSCTLHRNDEELLNQMKFCVTNALRKYQEFNGDMPKRVIIYRDGVGDGQIEVVKRHEIAAIRQVFNENKLDPQFAFIIVSKRINSRFFQDCNGGRPINPPSGSVVDDVVTLPERYDFFLVSQSVRQGTVNPTSYNIIENTTQFSPDHFQRLSYKLTHLYYNWPGTVRVPCVCQYAHKLAYLIGTSVHRKPNPHLDKLLYFL